MQRLARFVNKHPILIIAVVAVLTGFFLLQFRYISMETDVTKMIPDIPEKKYFDHIQQIFGTTGEYIFIGVVAPPGKEIFSPETLRKIRDISRKIDSLPGVDKTLSPTETDYIKGTEWGIEVTPVLGDKIPTTVKQMEEFKHRIKTYEMFKNIVSNDNRAAAIIITVKEEADKSELVKKIKQIVKEKEGPEKIYVGGKTVVDTVIGEFMMRDLTYLIPVVLTVIVIILYLSFRTLIGVLLPLSTVVISTIWAIGIMSLFKIPLSMSTFILPILLMAVGTAYGIHILTRYYEVTNSKDKHKIIEETLAKVGNAVLIAGLTTIAGFASLSVSRIHGIRIFGVMTGLGIATALCFSLLFIPSILSIVPKYPLKHSEKKLILNPDKSGYLSSFLNNLGEFVYRRKILILIITGVIVILFAAGIPLTSTESNPLLFFPSNNPCRVAEDVLNHYFMGTTPLQVIVRAKKPGEIKNPSVLKAIDGLENSLKKLPEVGGTSSINDFVKSINKALHEDKEKFYAVPNTRQEVAQYLLLYSMSADPTDFESFVDNEFQTANVMVFLKTGHTAKIKKVMRAIKSYVKKNFPPDVNVKITGSGFLFIPINKLLVNTFIESIILSLLFVFIICAVIFRSLKAGIFSLIPISIAIVINFGVMGWFKIPLNIGTVAISAIAVGIGIDYAVHFISRLRMESANRSFHSALILTTRTTGKAILYNAIAVAAGFLVLLASSIKWYNFMGELMALVMVISAMGALTILPSLIIITKARLFNKKIVSEKRRYEK